VNDNPLKENETVTDEKVNAQMVPKCVPAADAEWWSHHWIGPKGGDSEPWLWTDCHEWQRGGQVEVPEEMDRRGWVYDGPCERPEVVADLRRRLAAAEARAGDAVVQFPNRSPAP
jgi:hypothetical protein